MTNPTLETILQARGARYGGFNKQAGHAQAIKRLLVLLTGPEKWYALSDFQKESLEMISHKLARITAGDPNYDDSWRDIAGYANLVADLLAGGGEKTIAAAAAAAAASAAAAAAAADEPQEDGEDDCDCMTCQMRRSIGFRSLFVVVESDEDESTEAEAEAEAEAETTKKASAPLSPSEFLERLSEMMGGMVATRFDTTR